MRQVYLSYQPPRYERIRLLDQGATGSVYLGRRLTDNALVALLHLRAVIYRLMGISARGENSTIASRIANSWWTR